MVSFKWWLKGWYLADKRWAGPSWQLPHGRSRPLSRAHELALIPATFARGQPPSGPAAAMSTCTERTGILSSGSQPTLTRPRSIGSRPIALTRGPETLATQEERERTLAEAREQGREQVRQAVQEGDTERERILAEARAEAQAVREKGRAALERERTQIVLELRQRTVDLALLVVAAIRSMI